METALNRLKKPVHFMASNVGCAVFQFFVLFLAGLTEGFLVLFLGRFFWTIDQTHDATPYILPIAAFAAFLAICYALVWILFWWILDGAVGEIRWFYWKVAFSTLPFVLVFFVFDPHPNPMAMIPASHAEFQFVFSCLATGFIVYPLFSILLYKQFVRRVTHRLTGLIITSSIVVPVAVVVFLMAWNLMDTIYHLAV